MATPRRDHSASPLCIKPEDWLEIAEALATKISLLTQPRYSTGNKSRRWRRELTRILRTIGAEGEQASQRGVSPA